MRRLESLDWDPFLPGHFWPVGRTGFRENLEYYEFIDEAGQRALLDGVDADDYLEIRAYAEHRYRDTTATCSGSGSTSR